MGPRAAARPRSARTGRRTRLPHLLAALAVTASVAIAVDPLAPRPASAATQVELVKGGLESLSLVQPPAEAGSVLLFAASDGSSQLNPDHHGMELWRTDGTPDGTVMVKDIRPGVNPSSNSKYGGSPEHLAALGGVVLFSADDGENGRELWRSDGTEGGTFMVADIRAGSGGSEPSRMVEMDGSLYFSADDGVNGRELWRSDGTPGGTSMVKDIGSFAFSGNPGASDRCPACPVDFELFDEGLFFTANDGSGRDLWRSDGTEEGTQKAVTFHPVADPEFLVVAGELLFFEATDAEHGRELWRSDGTQAGTQMVRDINPGTEDGSFGDGVDLGGVLLFEGFDGFDEDGPPDRHGFELWRSDGTEEGTWMVRDIWPGGDDSGRPRDLTILGDRVLFRARDEVHGEELWRSDGTEGGTEMVEDIRPGTDPAIATGWTPMPFDDSLYFRGNDGSHGRELWRSDGTPDGTELVADVKPGSTNSDATPFAVFGGGLYFGVRQSFAHPAELWRTTPAGSCPIVGGSSGLAGLAAAVEEGACPPIVNSTGDGGDDDPGDGRCQTGEVVDRDGRQEPECTLRAAIEEANELEGTDTIAFDVPEEGMPTIAPQAPLPDIVDPVVIDGTTQPGTPDGEPGVEIDGSAAGETDGLKVLGGDSTIRGLVVNAFVGAGILLETGDGNTVEAGWIGLDADGETASPNLTGIEVRSSGNAISDNHISGNGDPTARDAAVAAMEGQDLSMEQVEESLSAAGAGVLVFGPGSGTRIRRNVIGGTAALTPDDDLAGEVTEVENGFGVFLSALTGPISDTELGGDPNPGGQGNLFLGPGVIAVSETASTQIGIVGNGFRGPLGVLAAGTLDGLELGRPDQGNTFLRTGVAAVLGGSGLTDASVDGNTFGHPSDANVIGVLAGETDGLSIGSPGAGNDFRRNGISVFAWNTEGTLVEGNRIGETASGPWGDTPDGVGVLLLGGAGNTVGGTGASGNTIAEQVIGILVGASSSNTVQGNTVARNSLGTWAMSSSSTLIGGPQAGEGNTIQRNLVGVWLLHEEPGARDLEAGTGLEGLLARQQDLEAILADPLAEGGLDLLDGMSVGEPDLSVAFDPGSEAASVTSSSEGGSNHTVQGNTIGSAGSIDDGNRMGLWVFGPLTNVLIEENLVANNRYGGGWVGALETDPDSPPTGVAFHRNRMFGNGWGGLPLFPGAKGMDLDLIEPPPGDEIDRMGPTPNDAGDADEGPNGLQNFPELRAVATQGGQTRIWGSLHSTPDSDFTVELFSSTSCHQHGFGGGMEFLGEIALTTDSSGDAEIDEPLPGAVPVGRSVTATASTDEGLAGEGSTSEFSSCVAAVTGSGVSEAAAQGATTLHVDSNDGFAAGTRIRIDPGGPNEEDATVAALGSLILTAPLAKSHALGEPVVNLCTVTGTPGKDLLAGTPGDDVICALGGDDVIEGSPGDDVVVGGPGNDTMSYSEAGSAVVADLRLGVASQDGQGGADTLESIENVTGSPHGDQLVGDGARNILRGGGGNDLLVGLGGNDLLEGGPGKDVVRAGPGNDVVDGGAGPDTLKGEGGADSLRGRGGKDSLFGGGGRDSCNGGPGSDLCVGGPGRDKAIACERTRSIP